MTFTAKGAKAPQSALRKDAGSRAQTLKTDPKSQPQRTREKILRPLWLQSCVTNSHAHVHKSRSEWAGESESMTSARVVLRNHAQFGRR